MIKFDLFHENLFNSFLFILIFRVNPRAKDLLTKINIFKEPFKSDLENFNLSEDFNQFLSESEQIAKEILTEEFREVIYLSFK